MATAVAQNRKVDFFVSRESGGREFLFQAPNQEQARRTAERLRRQYPDDLIVVGSRETLESLFEYGE